MVTLQRQSGDSGTTLKRGESSFQRVQQPVNPGEWLAVLLVLCAPLWGLGFIAVWRHHL